MAIFIVSGPFEVPSMKIGTSWHKRIDRGNLKSSFWSKTAKKEAKKRGVYIFALKVAQGYTPYYVGLAAKQNYDSECFTDNKLAQHYNEVLAKYKGTPVMFFVSQQRTKNRGKWNEKQIAEVEKFLIRTAVLKNPKLSNKKDRELQSWSIRGIINAGPGELNAVGKNFKKMMGL